MCFIFIIIGVRFNKIRGDYRMIDLINAADKRDRNNSGVKRWARMCERHQELEIIELERKEIMRMLR